MEEQINTEEQVDMGQQTGNGKAFAFSLTFLGVYVVILFLVLMLFFDLKL